MSRSSLEGNGLIYKAVAASVIKSVISTGHGVMSKGDVHIIECSLMDELALSAAIGQLSVLDHLVLELYIYEFLCRDCHEADIASNGLSHLRIRKSHGCTYHTGKLCVMSAAVRCSRFLP